MELIFACKSYENFQKQCSSSSKPIILPVAPGPSSGGETCPPRFPLAMPSVTMHLLVYSRHTEHILSVKQLREPNHARENLLLLGLVFGIMKCFSVGPALSPLLLRIICRMMGSGHAIAALSPCGFSGVSIWHGHTTTSPHFIVRESRSPVV